jgi:hypothetical protein
MQCSLKEYFGKKNVEDAYMPLNAQWKHPN